MNEPLLILLLTAISSSILGVLLYFKKSVMVADAIAHTVILGIVVAFWFVRDLSSPWLIIGAALMGLITVVLIEALSNTKQIRMDAAIGLVTPTFFSIAVLIITKFFRNVHLDIDVVLMGDIVFAPFNRLTILGMSLPKSFIYSAFILILVLLLLWLAYPIVKLVLFDEIFAHTIGISYVLVNTILMAMISLNSVIAFENTGVILVLALLIAPVMTASLLAHRFWPIMVLSVGIAIIDTLIGFVLANLWNTSIAGMISFVCLLVFMGVFSFSKLCHLNPLTPIPTQAQQESQS